MGHYIMRRALVSDEPTNRWVRVRIQHRFSTQRALSGALRRFFLLGSKCGCKKDVSFIDMVLIKNFFNAHRMEWVAEYAQKMFLPDLACA
jgi:hypothetical protein